MASTLKVNTINVRDVGLTENYTISGVPHLSKAYLIMYNSRSEYLINHIDSISTGPPGIEVLTVSNAIPVGQRPVNYWAIVCFLDFCRLSSDGVDFQHVQDEYSTIQMKTTLLRAPTGTLA